MSCRRILPTVFRSYRGHRASFQPVHRSLGLTISNPPSNHHSPFSTEASPPPLRRRRRRTGVADETSEPSSPIETYNTSDTDPFTPLDPKGTPLTSDQYLSLTSLSPWVPAPDIVIRRLFENASATSSDKHVDLGCGDGRLNFAAVSFPHHVRYSLGVDVDDNVLDKARSRMAKRFVPRNGVDDDGRCEVQGEMNRLEFVQGDLIKLVERQKEKYQNMLRQKSGDETISESTEDNSKIDELHEKIASSTVVTMYFVQPALNQLKPYLASVFGGRENVRIVTIGYDIEGWEPDWAERVLDLTVFRYDMKLMSAEPKEWSLNNDNNDSENSTNPNSNNTSGPSEEENELSRKILQQKLKQDMQLLDANLRIHHDQGLDDIASFRVKRKALEDVASYHEHEEEDDWDFDEDEDPEVLMKEEEKMRREVRMAGRKSLMAGLDYGKDGDGGKREAKSSKPVWRKPE